MTFAVAFLGSMTALVVMAVTVWTYVRHVVLPALQREVAEFISARSATIRSTDDTSEIITSLMNERPETSPGETTNDDLGMSYQDIADIMLTMTHTQRVTVLLLLQSNERDEVLNACIRAHNDARNISRNDVTSDIVVDEA